jgi:hypothetical protein
MRAGEYYGRLRGAEAQRLRELANTSSEPLSL